MFFELLRRYWGVIGLFLLMAFFGYFQGEAALFMIVAASAVHEAGHLAAVGILGGTVGFFSASAGGLQIRADSMRLSYLRESAAVLAGPLANLAVGLLLSSIPPAWPHSTGLAGANIALGIFNLLPAAPLDGWRFLQLALCWLMGPVNGSRTADFVGGVCAVFLAAGLLVLVVYSRGNLWLLPTAAAVMASAANVFQKDL